ncbi:TIGR03621 family F420-dependent LLM class oxidoreductase [Actinomycetes bacterium KLBMP 9797]
MTRPFRFGVQVGEATDRHAWDRTARQAEALGYATLVVPDHLVGPLAPLPALVAAAYATTTLRVGTLVLANDFRHPMVLAHEAATVDLLTDGRLELGLGAGWRADQYAAAGIDFDPPDVRVDRMIGAVEVVRTVLGGGTAADDHGAAAPAGMTRPVQKSVPILVGGGSRRVLAAAGRLADIVSVHHDLRGGVPRAADVTAEMTARKLEWVRAGAGHRFPELELEIGIGILWITRNRRTVLDSLARSMELSVSQVAEQPAVLVGSVNGIADQLRHRRERYGFSYIVVMGGQMHAAAPLVEMLSGT